MSAGTDERALAKLLRFTPIPRKNAMCNGWTEDKQRALIEGIARTGSVRVACEAVGMSYANVHRLRGQPGAASFNKAWDKAVGLAARRVREVLIDHSVNGVPVPLVVGGEQVGETRRFNHRTMMWVLQHHMPDQYGTGERSGGAFKRKEQRWKPMFAGASGVKTLKKFKGMFDGLRQRELDAVRAIADDPDKRAAYETLHGPVDWERLEDSIGGCNMVAGRLANDGGALAAPSLPDHGIDWDEEYAAALRWG